MDITLSISVRITCQITDGNMQLSLEFLSFGNNKACALRIATALTAITVEDFSVSQSVNLIDLTLLRRGL